MLMTLPTVDEIDVFTEYVKISFGLTPKTSTLVNETFEVWTVSATPTQLTDPFQLIDLTENYNSIAKLLTIYWNSDALTANTSYKIVITGLKDASGQLIEDSQYYFSTGDSVEQEEENLPPEETPVEIEDHSIKQTVFTDITTIVAANPDFYIVSVTPENFDFNLPEDYNNGTIEVEFSVLPNALFLNESYFKVQKRLVQRAPSRWETLDTVVSGDSSNNTVYVQLPSTDDEPVYGEPDVTYWQEQYKYRLIITKDVGI